VVSRRVYAWITTVDACWDYRVRLPFEALNALGEWDCTWGPPGPHLADVDVVVGQRLTGEQPDWLALCHNPNVLCVYDTDDDLIHLEEANTVPYQVYAPVAAGTRRCVAAADVVTVATPHVAEVYAAINPNVHVLPNCLDPAWLTPAPPPPGPGLVVGWAGSPFRGHDWAVLPAHLARFAAATPRATFHLMGGDYTGGVLGNRLRVSGLQPMPAYLAAMDFHIGLAPLARTPWNRGRSWTKAAQYAARGVPCVADAWGQVTSWVASGVNGLLVLEEADWVEHLLTLTDDTVRAAMSTAARQRAQAWTIGRHISRWADVYSGRAQP
jgi:glycosyltransferase involved in cell wall biosynthesis